MDSINKKTVYDRADTFKVNRVIVGIYDEHYARYKLGVIDTLGNIIIPIKYKEIHCFLDSFLYVVYFDVREGAVREKRGVLDLQGREIIPPIYNEIEIYHDIFAVTRTYENGNEFNGCYNLNLKKEIFPCKYKKIAPLSNQLIAVLSEGKYTYYNQEGNIFVFNKYDYGNFSDGFLDFGKAQMRPDEAIGNDVDSLNIAYTKCIAIYSGLLVFSCGNHYSTDDLRFLKGKNKIINEIKKIEIGCNLTQVTEEGELASLYFDLYQDAVDKNRDLINKRWDLNGNINDHPLVECNVMIMTLYKNGKSRDWNFITSMKVINKK